MTDINQFKNKTWIKHWAGYFSVVYNTMLGGHNTGLLRKTFDMDLERALYLYKQKYTFAFFEETQYQKFGIFMAHKIVKDESLANTWCQNFITATDTIRIFIAKNIGKTITPQQFEEYTELFNNYGTWHRAVKVAIDFLPDDLKQKYLPIFVAARLHAETVYDETETFVQELEKIIAAKTHYSHLNLLSLTNVELSNYLTSKILPIESVLAERNNGYAIVFTHGHFNNCSGQTVLEIERLVAQKFSDSKMLKGKTAYPGFVVGHVAIVFDPFNAPNFKDGDILVTGMTRPEFLPLMKKAGAFVTDAGGMLSHAAITARELKKPCVVGTEVATKMLNDGDLVEVDAAKGTIRKI